MATNEILTIAFSLLSAFSNAVQVPNLPVPSKPEDLEKYHVMPNISPLDIWLRDHRGTEFSIKRGTVWRFSSNDSYWEHQNAELSRFRGEPTLSKEQAIDLATRTVSRLAKHWNPIKDSIPTLRVEEASEGERLPFYAVTWPTTNKNNALRYSAAVEVDARKGLITFLELRDPGFYETSTSRMLNVPHVSTNVAETYAPEPARARVLPPPSTNQASTAVTSWLKLCRRLTLDPGDQTNLASINWDLTCVFTNAELSATQPVCQISFKNRAYFESLGAQAFSHHSADSCFIGHYRYRPTEEFDRFKGRIAKKWQDVAKAFELKLVEQAGVPKQLLEPLTAGPAWKPPEFESETVTRLVVDWREWPKREGEIPIGESRLSFLAEFDLQDGSLKWIEFSDPRLIDALNQPLRGPSK